MVVLCVLGVAGKWPDGGRTVVAAGGSHGWSLMENEMLEGDKGVLVIVKLFK